MKKLLIILILLLPGIGYSQYYNQPNWNYYNQPNWNIELYSREDYILDGLRDILQEYQSRQEYYNLKQDIFNDKMIIQDYMTSPSYQLWNIYEQENYPLTLPRLK